MFDVPQRGRRIQKTTNQLRHAIPTLADLQQPALTLGSTLDHPEPKSATTPRNKTNAVLAAKAKAHPQPKSVTPPQPWATQTIEAQAECDQIVAQHRGVITPAGATPEQVEGLVKRFEANLKYIRAPIEDLHTSLIFRDQFANHFHDVLVRGKATLL